MKLSIITPAKALNKAYLKQPLKRLQIETFKIGLKRLFSRINESESEEHLKNIVSDFLQETYYRDANYINTKERTDLVIHSGKSPSDSVSVIVETKRPGNKLEMVSKKDVNVKALQELVLYYLRETVDQNNHELKHLIATNIWEWFIFDAVWFEKNILRNTNLRKEYDDWKISGHDTKHFYEHVAAKHLDTISEEVPCTYFNLKDFGKTVANTDKVEDSKLTDLYKILSPEHLLKKPFANDSNSLNKEFYTELLHIIGLEEGKEGSKKIIQRKPQKGRDEGSLLENTITILKVRDKLKQVENPTAYGGDEETQLFSVALELCITWLNRILFLKLLEGQLIKYHRGDEVQSFLSDKRVADYDELNELFFEVLAVPVDRREKSTKEKFRELPYLNSSLFEETELESATIVVSELKGRFEIPVYTSTVLKDAKGKRANGRKRTLQYLFEFLDTYDFSSDSSALIQEENKSIINASVLGLIFEKINGYKDGSYFTPGFITMYMCRETIRKAVVQKFRDSKLDGFENLQQLDDLKDKIDHTDKNERKRANDIINSMTICDPAVGSGHFLVSALNELIAIKSDLQILNYRDGSRVKGYTVVIENDELIITNEETDRLFDYVLNVSNKPIGDLQKLQEALFHEKQTIIENCLFGVDINPKSVMICRLRLWIELLKNSYYTEQSKYKDLETLPNIDINIKCGNSLISRFRFTTYGDTKKGDREKVVGLLRKYRTDVWAYKACHTKSDKDAIRKRLNKIKEEFQGFSPPNDPDYQKIRKVEDELFALVTQLNVFDEHKKEKDDRIRNLTQQLAELREPYEEKLKTIYSNGLEWRFEFPEVLDDDGKFIGFDVVMGNPPYGVEFSSSEKVLLSDMYSAVDDIYTLFLEKGIVLTKNSGYISLIIPIFWLTGEKYYSTRKLILEKVHLELGITLPYDIFSDAFIDTGIYLFSKERASSISHVYEFDPREKIDYARLSTINLSTLRNEEWASAADLKIVFDPVSRSLINKINRFSTKIEEITDSARGILADSDDYVKTRIDKTYEVVFVGKIDRYFIEKDNFQYIKYGENLKEKPSSLNYFVGDRILVRRIVSRQFRIMATLTEKRFVTKKDVYLFKVNQSKFSNKYLLAIINSKLISFVKTKGSASAKKDDFTQLTLNDIRQIGVPEVNKVQSNKIEKLVEKILEKKQKSPTADTNDLEKQIDEMVYEIYGLTEEEIRIVEGKNGN